MASVSRIPVLLVLEDGRHAEGELVRFQAPKTTDALLRRMPIEGRIARWKEEVYFETDIAIGLEKPRSKVETGTIAFWPMGSAVCVFYGQTQPYSPVNIIGVVKSGIDIFRDVAAGTKIRLEKG
ncbi:MAG: cyclophilin-like fold protein [Candidatus Bathyarchaeia archaeon]